MDEEKKSRGVKDSLFNFIIQLVESGALRCMSGGTRKVLDVLMAHRNPKTGTCWPSAKTIENESGVTKRQVFRALSWLIAAGIIERKKGPAAISFVNVYKISLNPKISPPPRLKKQRKSSDKKAPEKYKKGNSKNRGGSVQNVTPLLCSSFDTHLLGDKTAPQKNRSIRKYIKKETSKTHLENKKKNGFKEMLEEEMDKHLPCGEKEFEELKREIKAKLSSCPGGQGLGQIGKRKRGKISPKSKTTNKEFNASDEKP